MLYGLSPPAKRKYSNLKQLVGWQIVKRNKKKNSIAGVTSGRWTTATQGDFKRGLSLDQSDLEGLHTYWEHNRDIHATKAGWGQLSHSRVVSAFYCRGNSCVDMQLSEGYTLYALSKSLKCSLVTSYIFAPIRCTKVCQQKGFKMFNYKPMKLYFLRREVLSLWFYQQYTKTFVPQETRCLVERLSLSFFFW